MRAVEVKVNFENKCKDHYLRVMLPTHLEKASHIDSGGHFYVDSRPIKVQGPNDDSIWPDMATLPHQRFLDVSDGEVGLSVVNDCFTEYEVTDSGSRTIAISLLRAVKNWICTEARAGSDFPSQDGGQCFGKHSYNYVICPHRRKWCDANLPLQADFFNVPVRVIQTNRIEGKLQGGQASLFSLDNPHVRFSSLKKAQDTDNFVLRLYNPASQKHGTKITFCKQIKNAWLTNLNERRIESLRPVKNAVELILEPYKIITVEIEV
jgi:alpha-mannosidase